MNLHEYQSKDLLEKFGVNVQKGRMANSAAEAKEISEWILADSALLCCAGCVVHMLTAARAGNGGDREVHAVLRTSHTPLYPH